MFDPAQIVEETAGLNLPDGYDHSPLIELVRAAYTAGLDESSDIAQEQIDALLNSLRTIISTTTDPIAMATAIQAVDLYEASV